MTRRSLIQSACAFVASFFAGWQWFKPKVNDFKHPIDGEPYWYDGMQVDWATGHDMCISLVYRYDEKLRVWMMVDRHTMPVLPVEYVSVESLRGRDGKRRQG